MLLSSPGKTIPSPFSFDAHPCCLSDGSQSLPMATDNSCGQRQKGGDGKRGRATSQRAALEVLSLYSKGRTSTTTLLMCSRTFEASPPLLLSSCFLTQAARARERDKAEVRAETRAPRVSLKRRRRGVGGWVGGAREKENLMGEKRSRERRGQKKIDLVLLVASLSFSLSLSTSLRPLPPPRETGRRQRKT